MKDNLKSFIKIISQAACVILVGLMLIQDHFKTFDFCTIINDIGDTVAITMLFAWVFNEYIWKIPCVGKRLRVPNLNGLWTGQIKYRRKTDNNTFDDCQDKVSVTIKQTFISIYFKSQFSNSKSCSYNAAFVYDTLTKEDTLCFFYRNVPNMDKRKGTDVDGLERHCGSSAMKIDWDDLDSLKGTYWTDRPTRGEMEIKRKKHYGK